MMIRFIIIVFVSLSSISFSQSDCGALIGGLYMNGKGSVGIFVGKKNIAKIVVTFTAKDEYGEEVNFSRNQTFVGPFFSYGRYQGDTTPYLLDRYPMGFISGIQIFYQDRTKKNIGRNGASEMLGKYFDRIGRGY